jgi:hypothetical protein
MLAMRSRVEMVEFRILLHTCVACAIGPSVFKPLTHLISPSKMNFYNLVESSTTTINKNKKKPQNSIVLTP